MRGGFPLLASSNFWEFFDSESDWIVVAGKCVTRTTITLGQDHSSWPVSQFVYVSLVYQSLLITLEK